MSQIPTIAAWHARLRNESDFEIAGSEFATGIGYRVTVRHGEIDTAAFSHIDSELLRSAITSSQPLLIGATIYQIDRTFGPMFVDAVRRMDRISAISATVQSRRQIVTIIGRDAKSLADALMTHMPATVEWQDATLKKGVRDWGRKVGHAAKDLAGLRNPALGLEHLEMLERSGETEAYEAIHKGAIWPIPTLDDLHAQGVTPTAAFGIVQCWRMLKKRPARKPGFRLAYLRDLPVLSVNLKCCRTLDEFHGVMQAFIKALGNDVKAVVGTRLPSFARRLDVRFRSWCSHRDTVLRELMAIEALPNDGARWDYAAQSLDRDCGAREQIGRPLPTRPALCLDQLIRSGPHIPEPPAIERGMIEFGISGLELGNYVTNKQGQRLAHRLAEGFTDLRHLLGDWIVPLCRLGNLSVALGARGHGKWCAHYEPALRVINLTKLRGDGSLAHEFGHFLDHMLAAYSPTGDSRYLSDRLSRHLPTEHPISLAMYRLMQTASISTKRERVVGEVNPKRWLRRSWIASRGYDPALPPQESFDRVTGHEPKFFRVGRNARRNSVKLVHSIAVFGSTPVEVEITYDERSDFAEHAKALGVYWARPHELFARVFESFVEDEATRRCWRSEYLVRATRRTTLAAVVFRIL